MCEFCKEEIKVGQRFIGLDLYKRVRENNKSRQTVDAHFSNVRDICFPCVKNKLGIDCLTDLSEELKEMFQWEEEYEKINHSRRVRK